MDESYEHLENARTLRDAELRTTSLIQRVRLKQTDLYKGRRFYSGDLPGWDNPTESSSMARAYGWRITDQVP